MNMHAAMHASRRDILKGTGSLIVSFSFAGAITEALAQGAAGTKPLGLTEVDSFLAIDPKGKVTVYSGKVDLGTGIRTALMQMVADELDVSMRDITMVEGDTATTPAQGTTWGSLTIQIGGIQLRNAAAVARQALLEEAAKQLNTKPESLRISNGIIFGGPKRLTYGELIGGKQFNLKVDHTKPPKRKDPNEYRVVGKSVPRVDIPAKLTGTFTYIHDFRVPGMLHGRVVRPPAFGAKLQSVDESSIRHIPNARVVRQGDFLAVVAETEWNAIRAARALQANWSKAETLPEPNKLWEYVRNSKIAKDEEYGKAGDSAAAMAVAARKISATYDFTIHTHGSIGPSCAVAEFKDGKLVSWSASQATHNLRNQLAKMFGMPPADVRCIYLEGSGCYGRNGHEDAAADAALLAKITGRPVRVQWSRGDEHIWDPKGPPTLIDLRAGLDASGNVIAWEHESWIPQQTPGGFHVPLIAASLTGMPADDHIAPGNIFQNAAIGYKFPNAKSVCHRLETTPFRPSWIRTPGRMQNTYANECFMDELAATLNVDPIEFRLKYLDPKEERGIDVLKRLKALAKWETRPSPRKNVSGNIVRGRGMSYVKYENSRTYVATVCDVEVNRTTGEIRVPRFYVVHDCGQIINPDGLRNQIEGNVIQTLSRTLIEEVKFDRSRITSVDWETYPILTFPQVPDIFIDLVDRPNAPPWGAGEPAAAVIPSAVSNAVFDATGIRVRSVPFTPDKVRAAMKGSA
ncbi:MAG TPA: molybdopterin cofactor-binding domain-containing protein [Xanthobacteraceae bacterium]|nr:molybdopterin cofactor-binding domain-containing protein [Xanthobacteraceae bacterium]